jgi:hypothetical protein
MPGLLHHARKVRDGLFRVMIDGSGSLCCRIVGRLRPVRIVRTRDGMPHQSADRTRKQIVLQLGLEVRQSASI